MPSSDTPTRKLATIMFTDIAGFTSQMSKDEAVALSLLDTKRKFLKPLIKKYNGTFVKEMGDGTLSHFPTANDAVNCSLDFQKSIKDNNDLNVRVGIHMDDTLFNFPHPHFFSKKCSTSTAPSSWSAQTHLHESGRCRHQHLLACHACQWHPTELT